MRWIWKYPVIFWRWSITWPWFAVLFLGGAGLVAVNEPAVGLILIGLALFSLSSRLCHANAGPLLKVVGTGLIMMLMLLCIMAGIAYKEEKPWSNVSTFWNRFVVLKTISEAEALKWSIAHPPRIDFPSTIIPIPNARSPRTPSQRPYDLTGNRRKEFLEWLGKPQNEPRDILRIGCTSWSESSCVAAGKFLILFSEAGWPIDSNRVFRMEPQIPIDGMAMATGGEIPDSAKNLPPHLGVWEKMDASQVTIWWAFRHMGIPVSSSRDTSLPPKTLGIYFGPEPKP